MADITDKDKFNEAAREVAMRMRHYPGMVERGTLPEAIAAFRTKVMQAIAVDYENKLKAQEPELPMEASQYHGD